MEGQARWGKRKGSERGVEGAPGLPLTCLLTACMWMRFASILSLADGADDLWSGTVSFAMRICDEEEERYWIIEFLKVAGSPNIVGDRGLDVGSQLRELRQC
jgi:hypothetical protein